MGYIPPKEEALLSSLSAIALIVPIAYEEEPLQPTVVEKPKRVQGKKGTDGPASAPATQSTVPVIQSTAHVFTCSATKAAAEASAAPEGASISAIIGNPSMEPSMVLLVASQSEATILSLRKRKVAAPDASVTSSGTISISTFIENKDLENLIKIYQVAQKHDPIYICIQEFLTRVSLYILSRFYFVIAFSILQVMLNDMLYICCLVIALANVRLFYVIILKHAVLVAIPSLPGDIQGLICSLRMPLRTSQCLESLIP